MTYFASALDRFLATVLQPSVTDAARTFVVFPDGGAHKRFYTMVLARVAGLPCENVLWIDKVLRGRFTVRSAIFQARACVVARTQRVAFHFTPRVACIARRSLGR